MMKYVLLLAAFVTGVLSTSVGKPEFGFIVLCVLLLVAELTVKERVNEDIHR